MGGTPRFSKLPSLKIVSLEILKTLTSLNKEIRALSLTVLPINESASAGL